MARVVHAVDVEIKGELDPSLAKAVGMTEAEFKRLQSAAKTFNDLMGKMVAPREAINATSQINSAIGKMESRSSVASRHMREHFHLLGEEGKKAAEKIQGSLAKAFDSMVEHAMHLTGIGGILGTVGGAFAGEEFLRGAFEVRAERGVLQNQLRSVTEAAGRGFLAPQVDALIRNMEGRETPVRYKQLLETSNLLLSAAPGRFQTVDQMHKMLGQLADVSRDPEAFNMVSQAFTRILAEGKVDAQHLNEMSVDTGFAFKTAMANALKVTPEQLSEMLKKHKLTGEQQINALMEAFNVITGPGGAAYKHAEAQLSGLAGIQSRFIGHWEDFQESFGMQLENFISPIADRIFALLSPAALTHAFDQMTGFAKGMGEAIGSLVDKLGHGKAAAEIGAIGNALGQMIGKLFGTTNFGAFFKEVQDPISGIHTVLTATGQAWQDMISTKWADSIANALAGIRTTVEFIQQHFNAIKLGLEAFLVASGLSKAGEMAKNIGELFKGIFTIGHAVINVASGTFGKEGAAAGEAAAATTAAEAGVAPLITSIPAFWLAGGGIIATELHRRFGILGKTPVEPGLVAGLPGAGIEGGAARADTNELFKSTRQIAEEHRKAAEAVKATAAAADKAAPSLNSISPAANSAASSLNGLAAKVANFQMPAIPLAPSPSGYPAVPAHQHGGIAIRPHVGLIGEAGPEAIIPLHKASSQGLLGGVTINAPLTINGAGNQSDLRGMFDEHLRAIVREVQRTLAIQYEQEAVV